MSEEEPENVGVPEVIAKDGPTINVQEDVTLSERLKRKHYRAGGKLASEAVSRDAVDRRSGRPTWEEMVFDHENDRYQKTVTDKETGELIIPKKDVRLSEHQGYGAAKPQGTDPK